MPQAGRAGAAAGRRAGRGTRRLRAPVRAGEPARCSTPAAAPAGRWRHPARPRRSTDALEQVGLGGVGRRPVQAYSLGMRQRLGLAGRAAAPARAARARRADQRPGPAGHPRDPRRCCSSCTAAGRRSSCPATCWPRWSSCAPGSGVLDRGRLVLQDALADAAPRRPGATVVRHAGRRDRGARPLDGRVDRGRRASGWSSAAATRPRSTPGWSRPASRSPGWRPSGRTPGAGRRWPRTAGTDAPGGGGPVIAVELRKLFRRPRTWATIGVLNALPILVAVLLASPTSAPRPGEGPAVPVGGPDQRRAVPARRAGHRAAAVPADRGRRRRR